MGIKFGALGVVLLILWSGVATSDDTLSSIPLSKLYSKYSKFLTMPAEDRQRLVPRYKLQSKHADPADVKLSFEFRNAQYHIPVDKDGSLAFFPTEEMLETNPVVFVDQPKGSMGINLMIGFKMEEGLEFDMRQLHDRVHKAFKTMKSLGGALSFFAPSHSDLHLVFDPACQAPTASFEHKGIQKNLMEEGALKALVPFNKDKKLRKGGTLILSCPVVRAGVG